MKAWDEAKKKAQADSEAKLSTAEGRQATMAEAAQIFAKHADEHGRQTIIEFQKFAKEHANLRQSRGEPDTIQTPEKNENWYNAMNKVDLSSEGISFRDMMIVLGTSYEYQKQKLGQ